jgi:hypothetical protein
MRGHRTLLQLLSFRDRLPWQGRDAVVQLPG